MAAGSGLTDDTQVTSMSVAIIFAGVYLVLVVVTVLRRSGRGPSEAWLIGFNAYSVALMGLHAARLSGRVSFPALLSGEVLIVLGLVVSTTLVGMLTLAYLGRDWARWLALIGGLWLVGVLVAEYRATPYLLGSQPWLEAVAGPDALLSAQIVVAGWALLAVALVILTAHAFMTAPLPLYANRIMYWGTVLPWLVLGDALSVWSQGSWFYVGYGLRLAGALGATYGVLAHRLLDIRTSVRQAISYALLVLTTAGLALGAILLVYYLLVPRVSPVYYLPAFAGVALVAALLYQPVQQIMRQLMSRLLLHAPADPAQAVREYSETVSGIIDLGDLADLATLTINRVLGTRRSGLLVVSEQPKQEEIALHVAGRRADPEETSPSVTLQADSPIYRYLVNDGRPLLQYDVDFHADFRRAPEAERRCFRMLQSDVYAPIVDGGELIGVLAVGPKASDEPFAESELELLGALANQTVGALQNARLVSDLRSLNTEMAALNVALQENNVRLERMDAVKTDFITIASHELRTPLTQIKGYVDVLAAMKEHHVLDSAHLEEVADSIRHASDRLEQVISAMLDVSQLDVKGMDLHFVETSLANIMRLATEPYAGAIVERNLTLEARGLKDLPPIYADYQRIVQAFQNLISNAIKFTPDGGRIDISASPFEQGAEGKLKSVRVVISDTGVGIDPTNRELIFEKFFRVGSPSLHSTGSTKFMGAGPGLGLPIAKGVIEAHGGRIWAESPGHDPARLPGSTFYVILPLCPPAMQPEDATLAAKRAGEGS
jgi:signal transduction histidine kinase